LGVADQHPVGEGGDLDTVAALRAGPGGLAPGQVLHWCAASVISSIDGPTGRASLRTVSQRRLNLATISASLIMKPRSGVSTYAGSLPLTEAPHARRHRRSALAGDHNDADLGDGWSRVMVPRRGQGSG